MSVRSLTQFLELLEKVNDLTRVTVEVSTDLEIAEIVNRSRCGKNTALLFENVSGRTSPLVTNCFGAERRICLAIGADNIVQTGQRLIGDGQVAKGRLAQLAAGFLPDAYESLAPRVVKTAACQQVVEIGRDIDLNTLPALCCSDDEAIPSLTAAYVVSANPSGSERSLTKADFPIVARNRLAVRWQPHDSLARHFESYSQLTDKMPVAVVLGGPPAPLLASYAACPRPVDGYLLAGVLADSPVELATCRTHELQVPAVAELVIEGYIDPSEPPVEVGLSSTSDGCHSAATLARTIDIIQITQQSEPIFPAFVHTAPPNEETVISSAVERILLPVWQQLIPELSDFHRPPYSGRQHLAFVSIQKNYPYQGQKVANALRGHLGTMANKLLIIVDDDFELCDQSEVWRRVSLHSTFNGDLLRHDCGGEPAASTLTIDATAKLPGEVQRHSARRISINPETKRAVDDRWGEYGLK
ncbi:MAG: UbiD family decarboxylase domain-containing protein [Pirellulales bacterium]